MNDPKLLAIARDYGELIDALRGRVDELGLTMQTLDDLSGVQQGYCAKILGPAQSKSLGPISLGCLLQALGLSLQVVEDPEAVAMIGHRWERRAPAHHASRVSKAAMARILPLILRHLASRGGKARHTKLTSEERSRIAREAARARWRR
jgi:hypothetical protein